MLLHIQHICDSFPPFQTTLWSSADSWMFQEEEVYKRNPLTYRMSYSPTEKEIQCVVHWFQGWSQLQKQDFLKDILDKAIPCHMDALFDSMKTMNVDDKPPSIYQCQMKLFNQWFESWAQADRSVFMIKLREVNSAFVDEFERQLSLQISLQNGTWWNNLCLHVVLELLCWFTGTIWEYICIVYIPVYSVWITLQKELICFCLSELIFTFSDIECKSNNTLFLYNYLLFTCEKKRMIVYKCTCINIS